MKYEDKKWITLTEYVDVETGELIGKSLMEREYYKTGKKTTETITNDKYNIKRHIIECRKTGIIRLF